MLVEVEQPTTSMISATPGRIWRPDLPSLCNRLASVTIIDSNVTVAA